MVRAFACLAFAALQSGASFSQSIETPPTFEASDVHLSASARNPFRRGPFNRGGRFELRTATMADLIAAAYGVDDDKVVGGPSWLEMDRFDVIARTTANTTPEMQKIMLQALLVDRFKLVVHNDTKPMPAYALTVGKHAQLKEADGSGDTGCKFTPPSPPPQGPQAGGGIPPPPLFLYTCRNMSMAAFAQGMRRMVMADQYLGGSSVVDQTGLKGSWDFSFKYSPRIPAAMGNTITMVDAIDKQLGLKLEPVKVPLPVIVVDSVNQKPTDNLPGVVESLRVASAPTEFEVADVRPSDPETRGMRFQIQPGGRVNLTGVTLKFLIEQAWNISGDTLAGAPKWLDGDRFDIIAKASTSGPIPGQGVDIDTVWLMLRALLQDRFKLATHSEDRLVDAYNLVAVKPKLKKADPTSRTRFKEGPSADGKDPRDKNPMLSRLVTCQNMTMAQFAEKLQSIAPGYIHTPVLDATGLEGSWDFTLSFSPAGMDQFIRSQGAGGRGGGEAASQPSGGAAEASDPSGAITLFEAIEKQLGLKLEKQKRPASVLVIDHVEQKPTDN